MGLSGRRCETDIPKYAYVSCAAKFLFKLGLRRYPPLSDLIALAANSDEKIRTAALKYLVDNFPTRYANEYNPNAVAHIAFIPAIKDGKQVLTKPLEVRHVDLFPAILAKCYT